MESHFGSFFNNEGKLIARISKNELTVNESRIFRTHKERPDANTLDILNEYGQPALYIRYLNPHSVKFLGRLYYSVRPSVGFIIEDDAAHTVGLRTVLNFEGNCVAFVDSSIPSISIGIPEH